MVDIPTNSSFIPKRNATENVRRPRRKNFFVLSFISTVIFIGTPVAAAAAYAYQLYVDRELAATITALDSATKQFDTAKMDQIIDTDARLTAAQELLNSHISLVRALDIIEAKTAKSVAFDSISFDRTSTNELLVTGPAKAIDFDVALFQRSEYANAKDIGSSTLSTIIFVPEGGEVDGQEQSVSSNDGTDITFTASLVLNADKIVYSPSGSLVEVPISAPTGNDMSAVNETVDGDDVTTTNNSLDI